MARLPDIIREGDAVFYVCPLCGGQGFRLVKRTENGWHHEGNEACSHCFGFGRVPIPSWYREQQEAGRG